MESESGEVVFDAYTAKSDQVEGQDEHYYYDENWQELDERSDLVQSALKKARLDHERAIAKSRREDKEDDNAEFERNFPDGLEPFNELPENGDAYYPHTPGSNFYGNYGFRNKQGEVKIEAQFTNVQYFSAGLAAVCPKLVWFNRIDNGKPRRLMIELYGYIDITGDVVIPFKYDWVTPFNSQYGLAAVSEYGQKGWQIIDKTGKTIERFGYLGCYDYAWFHEGGRYVTFAYDEWEDDWCDEKSPTIGVYDLKERRVVIEPKYYDVNIYESESGKVEIGVSDSPDFKLARTWHIGLDEKPLYPRELLNPDYPRCYTFGYASSDRQKGDANGLMKGARFLPGKRGYFKNILDIDGRPLLKRDYEATEHLLVNEKHSLYLCSDKDEKDHLVNRRSHFDVYKLEK